MLRPGGALFLTTTNLLCPIQAEFSLPLYSRYPAPLKCRYERLALTSRPDIANFAKCPAVHWFTASRGFRCIDRLNMIDLSKQGRTARLIIAAIHAIPVLRWLAHVCTPGTILLGIKGAPVRG